MTNLAIATGLSGSTDQSPTAASAQMQFQEWTAARQMISSFDDKLHDVRKYGFTFLSGLLSADAVIGRLTSTSGVSITPPVKFAVVVVGLVLVCGLRFMDKNYEMLQQGASKRAEQLEQSLSLKLTHTVATVYAQDRIWQYTRYLYYAFALATGILGVSILLGEPLLAILVIVATVITFFVLRNIDNLWKWTEEVEKAIQVPTIPP